MVVGSRWIYKIKDAADGNVEKYKARFVAKGYAQKEGIDYKQTFAAVARYTSIRSVISLAAQMGWEIHQMEVKIAFLNGVIKEEVYIEQPEVFETHEHKIHACRLKKVLYGLKQAPTLPRFRYRYRYRYGSGSRFASFLKIQDPDTARIRHVQKR